MQNDKNYIFKSRKKFCCMEDFRKAFHTILIFYYSRRGRPLQINNYTTYHNTEPSMGMAVAMTVIMTVPMTMTMIMTMTIMTVPMVMPLMTPITTPKVDTIAIRS